MVGANRSMGEVMRRREDALRASMHTALPGIVKSYDPLTCTADVEPATKHALFDADGEREYEALPVIPSVPIVWPRAGGYAITMPLAPGDSVLLVFQESSIAEWRETVQVSEPGDARRHALGNVVAVPGLFPDVSPLSPDALSVATRTSGMFLGPDLDPLKQIHIDATGIRVGAAAVSPVALAIPLLAHVALQSAAATAGAGADSALASALTAIQAALVALGPALPAAATAIAASGSAVTAANTAIAAAATAKTASAVVPPVGSLVLKSL